jgi:ADP-heptose:LPS heptosyltransferase
VRGPHIIESTASILTLFDISLDDCDLIPRMYLVDQDERKACRFLDPLRDEHNMLIGINLSAGRPARTWPIDRYVELLRLLCSKFERAGFILSAAPNERWKIGKVMGVHSRRVYPLPEGYSIREIAGLLKHLDFLITPDTSVGHIASCVSLPSLAMYPGNAENFAVWKPFNPCVRAINSPDPYRIEYLPSERVFEAFCAMVGEERPEMVTQQ